MATIRDIVRPGDVITSNLINRIIALVNEHDAAINDQTGGGSRAAATILDVSPRSGLRVGDRVTVTGRNFSVPSINNTISLDGFPVLEGFSQGGTAEQFVFDIPDIGLTSGRMVSLRVGNGVEPPASFAFPLLPRLVIPNGRIQVAYTLPPIAGNVAAAQSYVLGYLITALADQAGNYLVRPAIGAGWTAELLDETRDVPRASNTFALPGNLAGATQVVRIRVTVASAAAAGDQRTLNLTITETTTGTRVVPGVITTNFQVGQPVPTPETRVQPSLSIVDGDASLDGATVRFRRAGAPASATGRIQLRIRFAEGGDYQLDSSFSQPTGWTAEASINPIRIPTGGTFPRTQDVDFEITAGASAAGTDWILTIARGTGLRVEYRLGFTVS